MTYPLGYRIGGIVPDKLGSESSSKDEKLRELKSIVAAVTAMDPHRSKPHRDPSKDLEVCTRITETFKTHLNSHPAVRELAVQSVIIPERLDPIRDSDLFAGRFSDGVLGYAPEMNGAYEGYYLLEGSIDRLLASRSVSEEDRAAWKEIVAFWRMHSTPDKAYRESWNRLSGLRGSVEGGEWPDASEHWKNGKDNPLLPWFFTDSTNRVAGPFPDIPLLLRLGVSGLLRKIEEMKAANPEPSTRTWYEALAGTVLLFRDKVIVRYETEARAASRNDLADTLAAIRDEPPRTLRQAIQLAWLYLLVTRILNVGRMDVWFGPFLERDLASGLIDLSSAQETVDSLWKLMFEEGHNFNTRVIIGGKDREKPAAADRFALLCIDATRRLKMTRPQTTLRMHEGMDPEVSAAAFRAIGEGCTFPMLLNDDVNIPAVAKIFGVSLEEAARYVPLGCGELVLESINICSPNSAFILPKCLEYALHDGRDGLTGHQIGPRTGDPSLFRSFDDVWNAYDRQVRFVMEITASKHAIGYGVVRKEAPFLLLSALHHDCLEKGRGLLDGVRYLDGTTEVVGFVNTADSLTALKRLVYTEHRYSLAQVISALDANFAGTEPMRRELLACPKYGNDDGEADGMAVRVHEHAAHCALGFSGLFGEIRKFMIVHVNNHAHVQFGAMTAASADGRVRHETLANANNPAPGRDTAGTTAMLKSLAKIRADTHAGVVQNMKFSKAMFGHYLDRTKALLAAFFRLGGTQAMITVVSREDLEDAMAHPERHQNLVVRVGGYSARFVELSRELQLEILHRTLNAES